MHNDTPDDQFVEEIAERTGIPDDSVRAPSRLKSQIYSTLALRQVDSGPLASLSRSKAGGFGLCVFEELVRIAPIGESAKSVNICRVCHARVLAEHFENPPIYWPGCPYVKFQQD